MENKRKKLVKFYSGRHLRRLIASDNILDTSNIINDCRFRFFRVIVIIQINLIIIM